MLKDQKSFGDRMKIIRDTYAQELPNKVQAIEDAWQCLISSGDYQINTKELMRSFHTLAGSASTFGYLSLAEAARKGEQLLKSTIGEGIISKLTEQEIACCLQEMKKSFAYPKLPEQAESEVARTIGFYNKCWGVQF